MYTKTEALAENHCMNTIDDQLGSSYHVPEYSARLYMYLRNMCIFVTSNPFLEIGES